MISDVMRRADPSLVYTDDFSSYAPGPLPPTWNSLYGNDSDWEIAATPRGNVLRRAPASSTFVAWLAWLTPGQLIDYEAEMTLRYATWSTDSLSGPSPAGRMNPVGWARCVAVTPSSSTQYMSTRSDSGASNIGSWVRSITQQGADGFGPWVKVKTRLESGRLYPKTWAEAEAEPAAWGITAGVELPANVGGPGAAAGLIGYVGDDNFTVEIDRISVRPL